MDTIEERTEDRGLQVLDIDGDCDTDSEDEMDEEEAPAIPFPQLRLFDSLTSSPNDLSWSSEDRSDCFLIQIHL